MGNRIKEEERTERMIRSLMKLPENRRCMNCNNLGPQYVCTTFSTFVCIDCSGIHREFTHRVKSVSMAKFSPEEVTAIQAGGNEQARHVYLRYWDLQRDSFPDGSNIHKLREFIKNVYIDRKYADERRGDTGLSRLTSEIFRMDKDEARRSTNKVDSYRDRSKYEEDLYEKTYYSRRVGKCFEQTDKCYYHDLKFSPKADVDPRNGSQKRSPAKFEIVDDRFRDDRFGTRRFSLGDTVGPRRLSCSDTDMKRSCAVRPLQDILGERFPIQISRKSNAERADCSSAHNQESATKKPVENKIENSQRLIDFDTKTVPTNASTSQTPKNSSPNSSGSQTPNSTRDSQASKVKTLESLLFELSVPSVNPGDDMLEVPGRDDICTITSGAAIPQLMDSVDAVSKDDLPLAGGGGSTTVKATDEWKFESADGNSSFSHLTSSIGSSNSELSFSTEYTEIGSSISATTPVQDAIPGVESQFLLEETKPSSGMELPVDLFNASYLLAAAPVSALQTGMGYNYYPHTMPVPAFLNQSKSTNPFDIGNERSQFPSTANVLPAPTGSLHTSSLGTYSSQLTVPLSQANTYSMSHQLPYAASAFSPCAYTGQEVHNNFQTTRKPQGIGGFGNGSGVFVSLNPAQQPAALYPGPAYPSSSMGGNPFG